MQRRRGRGQEETREGGKGIKKKRRRSGKEGVSRRETKRRRGGKMRERGRKLLRVKKKKNFGCKI